MRLFEGDFFADVPGEVEITFENYKDYLKVTGVTTSVKINHRGEQAFLSENMEVPIQLPAKQLERLVLLKMIDMRKTLIKSFYMAGRAEPEDVKDEILKLDSMAKSNFGPKK